jgi:hypothetical protein
MSVSNGELEETGTAMELEVSRCLSLKTEKGSCMVLHGSDHYYACMCGVMGIYVGRWKAEDDGQGHIWKNVISRKKKVE